MCDVCAGLSAMRDGLEYQDKEGNKWNVLAVGEEAEGEGKFQIQRDGFLWQDKWIDSENIASSMSDLGADIDPESRDNNNWDFFQMCIETLGVQDNVPA